MEKLIEQIQESLKTNNSLTDQEKEDYFIRLELLKETPDEDGAIEEFIGNLAKKPQEIKEFFTGMEKGFDAYIRGGVKELVDSLE